MRFEYIPKVHADEVFGHIEYIDKFYTFVNEFNIIGVGSARPDGISASYFLRLLQEGSSARARGYGKGNAIQSYEPSLQEFYLSLLDHGALWKMKNDSVICTAMPYGNIKSITDSFNKMINMYNYPKTIRFEFLDDKYRYRSNGDYMVIIYCDTTVEFGK